MESSESSKIKRTLNVEEKDLVNRDKDIFDPVLSFDMFELFKLVMHHFIDCIEFYHAWASNLSKFVFT
jgi:hypothetical protein